MLHRGMVEVEGRSEGLVVIKAMPISARFAIGAEPAAREAGVMAEVCMVCRVINVITGD